MAEARARAWAAAPRPKPEPVELGPVAALLPRLPLVVAFAERPFRVVALEDGALVAHSTICPHWLGPLEDAPVEDGCAIRCPWHGWRFDARTGASLDGHRARLAPAPRVAVAADGMVTLVPADG
ncbi:Rieske 2Fe-2S domain-containing protein [Roseomonas arctica]|uniref:Rieske 2Fe-2S domain-containing protein n=2 Tax=Plastoroseomonas arctica TaxID=1509237 RepID=A0AAF1JUG5_9PROT|nr:Rieske 2Fe-2S domain-containing protein [Plastoroseomonas arctica]